MKMNRGYQNGLIVGLLLGAFFSLALIPAKAAEVETVLVLKVTQDGFINEKGDALMGELKIPKSSHLKIIFEYRDQAGDEHEFGLLEDSDEEIFSELLSEEKPRTEIVFFSGEAGRQFELYCIRGCRAMDKLTDLTLLVVA